jgi:hypothetical protein
MSATTTALAMFILLLYIIVIYYCKSYRAVALPGNGYFEKEGMPVGKTARFSEAGEKLDIRVSNN